jgi:membrane protease YdiL (CAAX protease family)
LEGVAFSALVLADIWLLRPRGIRGDILVLACMAASFVAHRETMASLGLGLREARAAISEWAVPLVACAVALFLASLLAVHRLDLLIDRGLPYFVWCVLQQLLLQNMVYRRVRITFGPVWTSYALTGCLFAAAHLPNPILVPATLFWGTVSAWLFERRRSIISIALLQTVLSSMLLWMTPASLNHQFHVGPGYWRHHSAVGPTRVLPAGDEQPAIR